MHRMACTFCGKGQSQIACLIGGPEGVFICDECVALCYEILDEQGLIPTAPTAGADGRARRPLARWASADEVGCSGNGGR